MLYSYIYRISFESFDHLAYYFIGVCQLLYTFFSFFTFLSILAMAKQKSCGICQEICYSPFSQFIFKEEVKK